LVIPNRDYKIRYGIGIGTATCYVDGIVWMSQKFSSDPQEVENLEFLAYWNLEFKFLNNVNYLNMLIELGVYKYLFKIISSILIAKY